MKSPSKATEAHTENEEEVALVCPKEVTPDCCENTVHFISWFSSALDFQVTWQQMSGNGSGREHHDVGGLKENNPHSAFRKINNYASIAQIIH